MKDVLTIEDAKKLSVRRPGKTVFRKSAAGSESKSSRLRGEMEKLADEHFEAAFSFNQEPGGKLDLEKALMAIGFLCEWGSDISNKDLDGTAANGFAPLLRKAAKQVRQLYTQDDIRASGGDPRMIWKQRHGAEHN